MGQERVYDLGTVDVFAQKHGRGTPQARPAPSTVQATVFPRSGRSTAEGPWPDFVRSLSLFIPGVSQIIRGRVALGVFYLSSLAFLGALSWAILQTLDRLAGTLELLGLSMAVVLWTVIWIFAMVVTIHLSGVWTATEGACRRGRHPALSAAASLFVPGWGQILNGDRLRAVLFLGGTWLAVGFWIAASTPVTELFNQYFPVVTSLEQLARSPLVLWTARWTLPFVIACLAVYDAASSAIEHRRQGLD